MIIATCIFFFEALFNCNFSIIEKPSPTITILKAESGMLKSNYHKLIATFFKGTAIDYYTISFNGTEETYSIVNTSENLSTPTWIHNVTKLNVTAHNCAGQSDPVIVYISHGMSSTLFTDMHLSSAISLVLAFTNIWSRVESLHFCTI